MTRKPGAERHSILLIALVSIFWMSGCASTADRATAPEIVAPSENLLRVGVSPDEPPLIFKQDQQIVGLEADFAREFAAYLGKSLRFIELKRQDLISALLDNRIDMIMSGMSITALREMRIAFSSPYLRSGQMALVRRDDAARFMVGYYAFSKSSAMGAVKDTTGEFFVQEHFSQVKTMLFSTSKKGVKALIDGKIDIFIHDAPTILYLASTFENKDLTPLYPLLTEEYQAWGIRKSDEKLLNSANRFMQSLERGGRLKAMIQRWIPFIH
jgi:ABC-type amino acid transport substrate-binding protein